MFSSHFSIISPPPVFSPDRSVLDAMLPHFTEQHGNPHSSTHMYGWESSSAVETAREQVASLVKADPKEIIFTSGATESNNIAIKGVSRFYKEKRNRIITTVLVHFMVESHSVSHYRSTSVSSIPAATWRWKASM